MPKIQPLDLLESHYNTPYRHRHHCVTDAGRAIRDAATHLYRDCALPTVNEQDSGYVHVYWYSPRRTNGRRTAYVLNATFPPGSSPDSKATVTCRGGHPQVPVAEHGQLTLAEMRPRVLEHTNHWKRNDWQPTGFRKQDGPYLITVQADDNAPQSDHTIWRVYRNDRIVTEGKSYGWRRTMRIAEQARNKNARQEKHNQANHSRYLAALRTRLLIHLPGRPTPEGKPATLCGLPFGKKRLRVDGRHGADAKATDANVCAACAEILQQHDPA